MQTIRRFRNKVWLQASSTIKLICMFQEEVPPIISIRRVYKRGSEPNHMQRRKCKATVRSDQPILPIITYSQVIELLDELKNKLIWISLEPCGLRTQLAAIVDQTVKKPTNYQGSVLESFDDELFSSTWESKRLADIWLNGHFGRNVHWAKCPLLTRSKPAKLDVY